MNQAELKKKNHNNFISKGKCGYNISHKLTRYDS